VDLHPGTKLFSATSDVQIVVVKGPSHAVDLGCGGHAMLDAEPTQSGTRGEGVGEGPLIGKRYVDEDSGLEVLCTRAGAGTLTVDGRPLEVQGAKPLPSSD